jgi:hypothetical protein
MFLWNMWWVREAWATGGSIFTTRHLFHPAGLDLTLHTHTWLNGIVGATALRALSPVGALGVVVLLSVAAGAGAAYGLARARGYSRDEALVAAVIFGASPFLATHLRGHVNLVGAWPIPLFALALLNTERRTGARPAMLAGAILGVTAYQDYYFVVFLACLMLVVLSWQAARVRVAWARAPRRAVPRTIVMVLLALDLALMAWIAASGGGTFAVGSRTLSIRTLTNPLVAAWALAAILLLPTAGRG